MRNWKYPIWIVVVLVILALGITYVAGTYRIAQQDYAIAKMRALVTGENNFAINHPMIGYSCKLQDITNDEAVVGGKVINGYSFAVSDCRRQIVNGPYTSFRLVARPKSTKLPIYCIDETGVLKTDYMSSATYCIKIAEPI